MPLMKEDFIGKRFGMLIAQRMFRDGSVPRVECLCDCGEVKIVNAYSLKGGGIKSCGCLRSITFNKTFTKHGNARSRRTKEYQAWRGMIARCNGNCSQEYYLEKGITVSPEWISDFPAFLSHVGMAPTSRHTIDRIDNGLGYQPGNVRWATPKEQARNRDNGVYVVVDGVRMLLVEASEKYSIRASIVRDRLAAGWPDEAAVKTPKHRPQRTASRPIERRT
mgnify:CR=1 FL=1